MSIQLFRVVTIFLVSLMPIKHFVLYLYIQTNCLCVLWFVVYIQTNYLCVLRFFQNHWKKELW